MASLPTTNPSIEKVTNGSVISHRGPAYIRNLECPICRERLQVEDTCCTHTSCWNAYHVSCLSEWISESIDIWPVTCPMCRRIIKENPGSSERDSARVPDYDAVTPFGMDPQHLQPELSTPLIRDTSRTRDRIQEFQPDESEAGRSPTDLMLAAEALVTLSSNTPGTSVIEHDPRHGAERVRRDAGIDSTSTLLANESIANSLQPTTAVSRMNHAEASSRADPSSDRFEALIILGLTGKPIANVRRDIPTMMQGYDTLHGRVRALNDSSLNLVSDLPALFDWDYISSNYGLRPQDLNFEDSPIITAENVHRLAGDVDLPGWYINVLRDNLLLHPALQQKLRWYTTRRREIFVIKCVVKGAYVEGRDGEETCDIYHASLESAYNYLRRVRPATLLLP